MHKGEIIVGKYKKCPRCELNYILSEEDLCPVCKAELKLAPALDDEDLVGYGSWYE